MYHVGICDDGQHLCSEIENMILLYAKEKKIEIEINIWYTGEGLCNYLNQGQHIDILFLDIELLSTTGIEVGSYIRNQLEDRGMQIIYISGKASYAQQLFKTQPMDFLIKPITQLQIAESLELAIKLLKKREEKFEFQNGKDYYYLPYGDILYFVSEGRKIRIVMADSEKEFYGRIKEIQKRLPTEFMMIHQSYIINKSYVERYTYESVELVNGDILTVSKVHRKRVREEILKEK